MQIMKLYSVFTLCLVAKCAIAQYQTAPARSTNGYGGSGSQQAKYDEPQHPPIPFAWGYDIDDGYGNTQYHNEKNDETGKRTGNYGYTDAYGVQRHVYYVADESGFRAEIKTNEPGTANENPADVQINAEEPPSNVNPGNKNSGSYGGGSASASASGGSSSMYSSRAAAGGGGGGGDTNSYGSGSSSNSGSGYSSSAAASSMAGGGGYGMGGNTKRTGGMMMMMGGPRAASKPATYGGSMMASGGGRYGGSGGGKGNSGKGALGSRYRSSPSAMMMDAATGNQAKILKPHPSMGQQQQQQQQQLNMNLGNSVGQPLIQNNNGGMMMRAVENPSSVNYISRGGLSNPANSMMMMSADSVQVHQHQQQQQQQQQHHRDVSMLSANEALMDETNSNYSPMRIQPSNRDNHHNRMVYSGPVSQAPSMMATKLSGTIGGGMKATRGQVTNNEIGDGMTIKRAAARNFAALIGRYHHNQAQ